MNSTISTNEIERQIRIARNTLLSYNSIGYEDLSDESQKHYNETKEQLTLLEKTLENMK